MAHLAAVVTAALLGAGTPAAWAGPATSARPATALEVQSEPAGAAVYVDGQLKGAAPVAVEGILAGDHTVRVVKDGFLENSRVVAVPASGRSLRVALTPTRTPVRAMMQVEPEPPAEKGGGGGGKKWLFIGLGAAALTAGGVGVYFLTKNDPPKISSVTANPSMALQGGMVSFSCVASDPEGKALSYSWSFGDGGSGTGANPTHVFTSGGTFNVSVDVTDDKDNKTTDATTVTVVSLSGVWIGRIANWPNYRATFSLNQSGATITGTFSDAHNGSGTITGSVTGPRSVALVNRVPGFRPGNWTGTLSGDGHTIEGTVDWFTDGTQGFTLTR